MNASGAMMGMLLAAAVATAGAQDAAFAPYSETVPGSSVRFEMVPIPRGTLEAGDQKIPVRAFWVGKYEVTWDEYDAYRSDTTIPVAVGVRSPAGGGPPRDADAVTRPTPPYADEYFGFGKGKRPVISVTHHAAMEYGRWLSEKTGKIYRLPTEAEWEYACRAGQAGPGALGEQAWTAENADDEPHPVGKKTPNAWGLFDTLGNVAEWTLDRDRAADGYTTRYPHPVRGGSYTEDPRAVTCSARRLSEEGWSRRDPQRPQSIWWHTDAIFVGFRLVRPVEEDVKMKGLRSRVTRESP